MLWLDKLERICHGNLSHLPTRFLPVTSSKYRSLPIRQRALTIAELLITLAVVIAIAALLFPSIQRSKKAAFGATATANLRQIYAAGELYRVDHDLNEFPHQSAFARTESIQRLFAHKHDPYKSGMGNAVRLWGLSTPANPQQLYFFGDTKFFDSVIHFRDIFRGEATLWSSGDPNAVVMVMHQSFETSKCPPFPVGVWGSHLRVTDSGSITTHWVDFRPERVPTGGQGTYCSPAKWFK